MKKKILLIGITVATVIGGGAGAYALGFLDGFIGVEEVSELAVDAEGEVAKPEVELPALFHTVPPLVVSSLYNGSLRYLQVKMTILTRSETTLEKLELNTPLIQDALIMLLDSYAFGELEEPTGKEDLRQKTEQTVKDLIKDEGVESVLFTGFVIQ